MGLNEGRGNLGKLMKDLRLRWQETRSTWDDENAREFEERFILPLEQDVRTAIGAMEQMAVIVNRARHECS